MRTSVGMFDNRFVIKREAEVFAVHDMRDGRILERFRKKELAQKFRESLEQVVIGWEFKRIVARERWGGWTAY